MEVLLARRFVPFLLIIVLCVEGVTWSKVGCVICGKKLQKGTFRSVRTSDDVENGVTFCLFGRASADIMPICWSTVQIYKCMVLERKAEAK